MALNTDGAYSYTITGIVKIVMRIGHAGGKKYDREKNTQI